MNRILVLLVICCVSGPVNMAMAAGSSVVLVPGAGGASPNDFLIRNQQAFTNRGLQVVVATSSSAVISAAAQLRAQGRKVTLVGMSAGTPTVAEAIAAGAVADRIVLVSGTLMPGRAQRSVASSLGSPARLPATLVVHNRNDDCPMTPPEAVPEFIRWSAGRARVTWVQSSGGPGAPCGPMSPHGFFGNDGRAVSAIVSFAR
jgi:dienelactone hydrolase